MHPLSADDCLFRSLLRLIVSAGAMFVATSNVHIDGQTRFGYNSAQLSGGVNEPVNLPQTLLHDPHLRFPMYVENKDNLKRMHAYH